MNLAVVEMFCSIRRVDVSLGSFVYFFFWEIVVPKPPNPKCRFISPRLMQLFHQQNFFLFNSQEFTLLSSKNGEYIHYLIGYVTFGLAKEGWKKGFNVHAGPNEDVSYWQQTCFTLEEDLAINYGDKMKGCFKMTYGPLFLHFSSTYKVQFVVVTS